MKTYINTTPEYINRAIIFVRSYNARPLRERTAPVMPDHASLAVQLLLAFDRTTYCANRISPGISCIPSPQHPAPQSSQFSNR